MKKSLGSDNTQRKPTNISVFHIRIQNPCKMWNSHPNSKLCYVYLNIQDDVRMNVSNINTLPDNCDQDKKDTETDGEKLQKNITMPD